MAGVVAVDIELAETLGAAFRGRMIASHDPDYDSARKLFNAMIDVGDAPSYSAGGSYVNMMMEEGDDRVRTTYGANYDRLAQIKGEYDPATSST